MQTTFANPKSTAVVSLILVLHGALLLYLLILGIEPSLGPLEPILNARDNQPDILGTAFSLTLVLILPSLALAINLRHILRRRREGNRQAVNTFIGWSWRPACS